MGLGVGWGGLGVLEGEALPPGVLLVSEVPHDWLFPRCAAVVHHGGAGALSAHATTDNTHISALHRADSAWK